MIRIFFVHRYSIDIALSAISLLLVVSRGYDLPIHPSGYALLFFAVMFIYNLDHALDQRKDAQKNPYFLWVVILSLVINVLLLVYLLLSNFNSDCFRFITGGAVLLSVVALYLIGIFFWEKKVYFVKELMVSLLFTTGLFYPMIWAPMTFLQFKYELLYPYFIITLLLLHNTLIISYFNRAKDRARNNASLALLWTNKPVIYTRMLSGLGFFILLFSLTQREALPPNLLLYFIFLAIIQQLIFNLTANKPDPRMAQLGLDSVYIMGLLFI